MLFCCSLSECYFAGKGAALILPPNERARPSRRVSTAGCDIQQHLQSMFYLLRPEETLKMVSVSNNCSHQHIAKMFVLEKINERLLNWIYFRQFWHGKGDEFQSYFLHTHRLCATYKRYHCVEENVLALIVWKTLPLRSRRKYFCRFRELATILRERERTWGSRTTDFSRVNFTARICDNNLFFLRCTFGHVPSFPPIFDDAENSLFWLHRVCYFGVISSPRRLRRENRINIPRINTTIQLYLSSSRSLDETRKLAIVISKKRAPTTFRESISCVNFNNRQS